MTRAATKLNFTLHHVVPVLPHSGWALLGEAATKWVPVSSARFSHLQDDDSGFTVAVAGTAGERVEVMALAPGAAAPQTIVCGCSKGGTLTLSLPAATCK